MTTNQLNGQLGDPSASCSWPVREGSLLQNLIETNLQEKYQGLASRPAGNHPCREGVAKSLFVCHVTHLLGYSWLLWILGNQNVNDVWTWKVFMEELFLSCPGQLKRFKHKKISFFVTKSRPLATTLSIVSPQPYNYQQSNAIVLDIPCHYHLYYSRMSLKLQCYWSFTATANIKC